MPTPRRCFGCRRPVEWWQRRTQQKWANRMRWFHTYCYLTMRRWGPRP